MTAKSMKSWQANQFGEINAVLKLKDVAIPEPGKGEAAILTFENIEQ
jgi:hypothetical protein